MAKRKTKGGGPRLIRNGDPCRECLTGFLVVYKTKRHPHGRWATRYLRCSGCGAHSQEVIAAGAVGRRRGRTNMVRALVRTCPGSGPGGGRIPAQSPADRKVSANMLDLISINGFAKRLEVSEQTILSWTAAGTCPAPSLILGLARWRAADLCAWSDAGFPSCAPPARMPLCKIRLALMKEDLVRDAARLASCPVDDPRTGEERAQAERQEWRAMYDARKQKLKE